MNILVGYTGFVGSNINEQLSFDKVYNSQNIKQAYGTQPDLCVYAGVPSAMFLANQAPEQDLEVIKQACKNIEAIAPRYLVLISSVAVYDSVNGVDEDHKINSDLLLPYGRNRLYLENWVKSNVDHYSIIRLPALYGHNLKKNFIFDLIHVAPRMLKKEKYQELAQVDRRIIDLYHRDHDDFYVCSNLEKARPLFEGKPFSALNFTDCRSKYQFYNLSNLGKDIQQIVHAQIPQINIVTEPVSAGEVYREIYHREFENELDITPYNYNIYSKYASKKYFMDKQQVLKDLIAYILEGKNGKI